MVGAGARRDVEVRRGGVELEETTVERSDGWRRLALVASSWRMERVMSACFEWFFMAALRGSRTATLGDDGDARRGCSWWQEVLWHGRSTVVEECAEQSGAKGKARGEKWRLASPSSVKR
jgi:hypothetical protein